MQIESSFLIKPGSRILSKISQEKYVERLWKKDASLWKKDTSHQTIIKNSLGWLEMPKVMLGKAQELVSFSDEINREGFTHVLLLGMGGSSLAPEVFRQCFSSVKGYPKLLVLDSTDPDAVRTVDSQSDPSRTLYIVSSKSGSTTEILRFFDYFYSRVKEKLGDKAGRNFIAITDSGTSLEKTARELKFRSIFINPSDIGGRYSALSYFGLVPCALVGINVQKLIDYAEEMAQACRENDIEKNPGVLLGAILGEMVLSGRDKITFITSSELSSLGLWLEQLLAESTGKEGKGAIPICEQSLENPSRFGKDRILVSISLEAQRNQNSIITSEALKKLEEKGVPVLRIKLKDTLALGAEFFRWEIATAVLGALLEINPFDQPNVQEAKDKTRNVLMELESKGSLPFPEIQAQEHGFRLSFSISSRCSDLKNFFSQLKSGDYLGLLVYVSPFHNGKLHALIEEIQMNVPVPVQFGFGPRYLHSTGQLHKGGSNRGIFLVLSCEDVPDLKIAGCSYSFGQLVQAQALGDFQALDSSGRRACFIRFKGAPEEAIKKIISLVPF